MLGQQVNRSIFFLWEAGYRIVIPIQRLIFFYTSPL